MSTQLLNDFIIKSVSNLEFSGNYPEHKDISCNTHCSDGSCRGDCQGSCSGTAAR